jgi:hypothetical protein
LTWYPDDHTAVALSSRSLSDAELEDKSVCLALYYKGVCELPEGLREISSRTDLTRAETSALVPAAAESHTVGYQDSDSGRVIAVVTFAGGAEELVPLLWFAGPDAEAVTVRGHAGWLSHPTDSAALLVWRESDGVIVSMLFSGLSDADALAAAESLRRATDAEWNALLSPPDAEPGTELASNDEGGVSWRVYVDTDGSVCADVTVDGSASSSCSGSSGPPSTDALESPASLSSDASIHLYAGRLSPAVTQVQAEFEGDDIEAATVVHNEAGDWYVVAFTGTKRLRTLTALDVDANVLGTVTLGDVTPFGPTSVRSGMLGG